MHEGCLAGAVTLPLASMGDPEGDRQPFDRPVIDAHVHLFPERVFEALWRWFDTHAWPIRYRLHAEQVIAFLLERGVERMVGLHYSHTPGMARELNRFARDLAAAHSQVWMLGTVLPGEPDARAIAREALETYRLRGLKLHCHVQRVAPDDPRLDEIYRVCAELGRPVLIHAGREPASPAYGIDVRQICSAQAIRRVLERHPDLTLVVPHLGADEVADYGQLLAEFPNLWLDTTMMLADYFPLPPTRAFVERWGDRLLYGSDFPNLPYAWDRELRALGNLDLPDAVRQTIVRDNARRLFDRL